MITRDYAAGLLEQRADLIARKLAPGKVQGHGKPPTEAEIEQANFAAMQFRVMADTIRQGLDEIGENSE